MKTMILVVTYNRLEYLKECISKLLNQTIDFNELVIFDNASTDGTKVYCEKLENTKIKYIRSEKNLGGAGGFKQGIKYFINHTNSDYIWLMDDDTIPNLDALANLKKAQEYIGEFGFLSSNVRWINNEAAKMNIPIPTSDWNKHFSQKINIVKIHRATFVSLLIPRNRVNELGYPIEEFFIWGDDSEYTERISKKYPSYFVGDSIVIHKMIENNSADIVNDTHDRIPRYKFAYRNRLFYNKRRSKLAYIKQLIYVVFDICKVAKNSENNKLKRIRYIMLGTFLGFFFNPKIEYPTDENGKGESK